MLPEWVLRNIRHGGVVLRELWMTTNTGKGLWKWLNLAEKAEAARAATVAEAAVKEVAQEVTGPAAKPENPLVFAETMLRPKSSWLARFH